MHYIVLVYLGALVMSTGMLRRLTNRRFIIIIYQVKHIRKMHYVGRFEFYNLSLTVFVLQSFHAWMTGCLTYLKVEIKNLTLYFYSLLFGTRECISCL